MKEIGEKIKERRKVLHITQRDLAELAEVSINTLTGIERGESNPSIKVLTRILDTVGLKLIAVLKETAL
ncbi:helix-turn-helix domain-containing protein [Bacteroides sp.]